MASRADSDSEGLLFTLLERIEIEGDGALECMCREMPHRESELREAIAKLRELGFVGVRRPDTDTLPERLGEFRLIRRIGSGGMGVVFEAQQESLERRVALKVVRPENLLFGGSVARFRREVAAVALMHHPGIVPIYTFGEEAGLPYFAMELVEGCTLAEALQALRGRSPRELRGDDLAYAIASVCSVSGEAKSPWKGRTWVQVSLDVAHRIAEALEHAHGHGVFHRDVKPSNIAIAYDGRTMLLDFGLAACAGETRLTKSEVVPGSLPYVSPEQLQGARNIDPRTDIYSLGVTLYEMLALRGPYTATSTELTMRRILGGEPRPLRTANPAVGREVDIVCRKAMDLQRSRRYQTAADFALDLSNLLQDRPIAARKPELATRALRWGRQHPRSRLAATIVGVVSIVAVGTTVWRNRVEAAVVGQHLTRARTLAEAGELDDALAGVEQALGLRPSHSGALALRTQLRERIERRAQLSEAQIRRLSDVKILRDLTRQEQELWPAFPERVPDMQAWLGRARVLLQNEHVYRASLSRLGKDNAQVVATGSFDDAAVAWQREILTELVDGIESLPDRVERVAKRLELAERTGIETVAGPTARRKWREAIADVAEHPAYGGLVLVPQMGLLPLWRNPQSDLWEFWVVQTGDAPECDPATGRVRVAPKTGLVLVLIPAGSFTMGSYPVSEEHPLGTPNADPHHRASDLAASVVEVAPFFISKFEMTQGQWQRVTGTNTSHLQNLVYPAEYISWHDAHSTLLRLGLVLPTDAEWEYAARAGTSTVYWTGDSAESLLGAANIADETLHRHDLENAFEPGFDDHFIYHSPAGSFRPNPWGLHDVHGNLWEWCRGTAYPSPTAAAIEKYKGAGTQELSRGGSFLHTSRLARSACRSNENAGARRFTQGVRPARSIEGR